MAKQKHGDFRRCEGQARQCGWNKAKSLCKGLRLGWHRVLGDSGRMYHGRLSLERLVEWHMCRVMLWSLL